MRTGRIAAVVDSVYAQTAYTEPANLVPAAPNTAAIQKVGDIPITPYTGIPNISLPIYTIKSTDVTAPISIGYHAGGIKIAEEASRVGLGWSLQAGGVITRTVLNLDDFASRPDGYHSANVPDLNPTGEPHQGRMVNIQGNNGVCSVVPRDNTNVGSNITANIDYEPDLYHFNFLGHSGSFYLKRDKSAVLLNIEKLEITYMAANGGGFQIKTSDGFTYLFEAKEDYLDYFSDNSSGAPVVNAWHLTKITSAKGAQVTFTYLTVATRVRVFGSFFETTVPAEYFSGPSMSCMTFETVPYYYYNTPNKEYTKLQLSQISFPNGVLDFVYSSRLDVENEVKLDRIELKVGGSQKIKEWIFTYGYFVGADDGDRQQFGTIDTRSKRLKLLSLQEKGTGTENPPPHVFTYNEPQIAPQKTSFAMDHWGYYNGNLSSIHLVPDVLSNYAADPAAHSIGIMGTSRNVNPSYNQVFVLTEIKYPTGGRTVFEFETNDFDIQNSNQNDFSFFRDYPEVTAKNIHKMYAGSVYTQQPQPEQASAYILDLSRLTVDENLTNPTQLVQLRAFFRYDGAPRSQCMPSGIMVQLCKDDGTVLATSDVGFFVGSSTKPMTVCSGIAPNYNGATFSNEYQLGPGKYIWKLTIPSSITYVQDVHLDVDFLEDNEQVDITNNGIALSGADFGGGLRIKRIVQYDDINTGPINVKKYQYCSDLRDGKRFSFGRRMARPVYAHFNKKYYNAACQPAIVDYRTWQRILQSESIYQLEHSISGISVGYDTVIVFDGENGEYGKTIYAFENKPHTIWDYSEYDYLNEDPSRVPRKPPVFGVVQNFGNGNVLKQEDYKNVNGVFTLVQETTNEYFEHAGPTPLVYGIERRQLQGILPDPGCQFEAFLYPLFVKSRKLLYSKTVKVYNQNSDEKTFVSKSIFQYNHDSHLQMTQETTNDSRGRQVATYYKYPLSFDDLTDDAAIVQMKTTAFMHSIPITLQKTIVDGGVEKITDYVINKYSIDATSGKVVLSEIATLDQTQPSTLSSFSGYNPSSGLYPLATTAKFQFTKFDANANPLEQAKVSDVVKSYLWDYNNQYPVVEVTNALQSQIAYTSFEAQNSGSWTYNGSVIAEASTVSGRKVHSGTVSSTMQKNGLTSSIEYVVSYWTKNLAPFTVPGTVGGAKQGNTVSGWTYFEHRVSGQTQILFNCPGLIDEVRCYPASSQLVSFTYDPLVGLTSKCDERSQFTYYEYDEVGRLQAIRDSNKNIVKTLQYKYKQ